MRPSFQYGFAQNATEALYPSLWRNLRQALCPSFGAQGAMLTDFSQYHLHGTVGPGILQYNWNWTALKPLDYINITYGRVHDSQYIGVNYLMPSPVFTVHVDFSYDTTQTFQSILAGIGSSAYRLLGMATNNVSFWESGSGGASGDNLGITGLSVNTMYRLTVTREGNSVAGGIKAYLNGEYMGGCASSAGVTLTELRIGDRPSNTIQAFDGQIGDLFIWDRVLTPQEIKLMGGGFNPLYLAPRKVYGFVPSGGSVDATPAIVSVAAQDLSVSVDAAIDATPATVSISAQNLTVSVDANIDITPAVVARAAQTLALSVDYSASVTPAVVPIGKQTATLSVDAATSITPASVAIAAQQLSIGAFYDASPAVVSVAAQALTVSVDSNITLTPAIVARAAQTLTLSVDTSVVVSPAVVTRAAQDFGLSVDAELSIAPAVVPYAAQTLTIFSGSIGQFAGIYLSDEALVYITSDTEALNKIVVDTEALR